MNRVIFVLIFLWLPLSGYAQNYPLPVQFAVYMAEGVNALTNDPLSCGNLRVTVYRSDAGHIVTLYSKADGVVRAADVKTSDQEHVRLVARMTAPQEWRVLVDPSEGQHKTELVAAIEQYDISKWSAGWCLREWKSLVADSGQTGFHELNF